MPRFIKLLGHLSNFYECTFLKHLRKSQFEAPSTYSYRRAFTQQSGFVCLSHSHIPGRAPSVVLFGPGNDDACMWTVPANPTLQDGITSSLLFIFVVRDLVSQSHECTRDAQEWYENSDKQTTRIVLLGHEVCLLFDLIESFLLNTTV